MAIAAPKPHNEAQRLDTLRGYRILDTKREDAFDDLTRIASQICGTPMALVSLIDEDRQWFKSAVGLDAPETARELAFCAHAILQDKVFEVPDAHSDIRFHDNALVTGAPHLRFYAGAPLQTPDGHALGTLCVLDRTPRKLSDDQKAALEALARQAMAQMELRKALQESERTSRYRSRLMAVMGHDLKQPVNVINMCLSLLEPELTGDEDTQTLAYARTAIDTLSGELDALAQASRLDQENVRIAKVPVQRVFDSIQANWGLRARSKGLELKVAKSDAVIETDEKLLGTIIGNLVGNAIKYTETGGVLVGLRRRGGGYRVEVWDTGVGIPDSQREKI
ncbi:MAG TPA: GAF domain-containing sensor histidine kinase, partial [Alphaproteobacteria bacterium]|nr:GAF domain-containing sensor histidine kinase [Alphaproteobacteria bacterium]